MNLTLLNRSTRIIRPLLCYQLEVLLVQSLGHSDSPPSCIFSHWFSLSGPSTVQAHAPPLHSGVMGTVLHAEETLLGTGNNQILALSEAAASLLTASADLEEATQLTYALII